MIITKSISCFARNTVTLLKTIRELKVLGIDVFFEENQIHSLTAEGEVLLTIHHNAALVKAALAFKLGFYGEGEKLLVGGHLQHGSIVVSEMIIRALLEICVGFGGDFDSFIRDRKICGLTRPFQCIDIKVHFL